MSAERFELLEKRSFTTYLARVKACERLARLGSMWNFSLLASSLVTAVDSIVLLVDGNALGSHGSALLTCASVMTLFISTSVAGMNLSGRSRDMFTSYRRIQRLCSEVEGFRLAGAPEDELHRLSREYDELLDNSDNHRACDYYRAFPAKRPNVFTGREDLVHMLAPLLLLGSSVALAFPAFRFLVDTGR